MGSVESIQPYLDPLRKSVTVPIPPERAFDLFTARMGTWWPLGTHSVFEGHAATCGFEPRVGGVLYEAKADGERSVWGTILAWEPPARFVVTWHPGRDAGSAQELEVRFTAEGEGTRVDLEHRDWQKLGAAAKEAFDGYSQGWDGVLAHYVAAAGGYR